MTNIPLYRTLPPITRPRPPIPPIDRDTFVLSPIQYIQEKTKKTQIVLHHTVGGSARSTFDWWSRTSPRATRVATSYIIDKDGTIYEVFSPDYWAYHLGVGNINAERKSIGIEIVSEGGLVKQNGNLMAFYNPQTGRGQIHREEAVDVGKYWRGFRYFDSYEMEQVLSLVNLTEYLRQRFDIPMIMHGNLWDHNSSLLNLEGIITHAQVRSDKSDVHPLFPVNLYAQYSHIRLL